MSIWIGRLHYRKRRCMYSLSARQFLFVLWIVFAFSPLQFIFGFPPATIHNNTRVAPSLMDGWFIGHQWFDCPYVQLESIIFLVAISSSCSGGTYNYQAVIAASLVHRVSRLQYHIIMHIITLHCGLLTGTCRILGMPYSTDTLRYNELLHNEPCA